MKTIVFSLRIFLSVLFLSLFTYTSFAHYSPRGLTGGSVQVAIQYNGIVYLGTQDAGVFESTNNQLVAWRQRAVGLKSGNITALTHSGKQLYAATADSGIFIFNGAQGSDLYWNKINNGLTDLSILSLAAVDTNTILAGSNGNGLFKTTDKGQNWAAINSALLNGKEITALTKGGTRFFALVADGGVFASDDSGATWVDLNDTNTLNIIETEYFTYNAATDELLVSNEDGLFILSSAGTTTTPAYTAASTGLPSGIHIHGLDNNGTGWFLASHDGVYAAATGTVNWSAANTGLPADDIEAIIAIGDTLIAGTSKLGAFKSNAAAISWSANNSGLTNINTYSVAGLGDSLVITATEHGVTVSKAIGLNPVISNTGLTDSLNVNDVTIAAGNIFYAVTANAGVFVSIDSGLTWTAQNNGLTLLNIKRVITANGRKYIIDAAGKVYQSALAGTTWLGINAGLPVNTVATSLGFYANQLILGTYGDGVFVKHRDSTSWTAFNTGLTDLNVTGVTSSAGKIFAGTDGSGVFVTNAGTAAWTATTPVLIPHFNAVPLDPSHIQYLTAVKDYVIAAYKGGIVGTYDGGVTWEPAGNQNNIPSYANINKVSFVTSRVFLTTPTNNTHSGGISELEFVDTLLVINEQTVNAPVAGATSYHDITSNVKWQISAADAWVTVSVDSGSWSQSISIQVAVNTGLPRTSTVTLTDGVIIRTVTIAQEGTTGIANVAETTTQIFPNPFSNQLTVKSTIAENTFAVVRDIAGKIISTTKLNTGITNINTSELSKGIYLLHIITGSKTLTTQKLVKAE